MLCTYKIFPPFYLLFLLFAFRDHLEAISKERPIFISHLASDVLVDVLLSYSGLLHFWEAATLSEILMKAKSPFPRNMPVCLCVRQSILCTESGGPGDKRSHLSVSLFLPSTLLAIFVEPSYMSGTVPCPRMPVAREGRVSTWQPFLCVLMASSSYICLS